MAYITTNISAIRPTDRNSHFTAFNYPIISANGATLSTTKYPTHNAAVVGTFNAANCATFCTAFLVTIGTTFSPTQLYPKRATDDPTIYAANHSTYWPTK